MQIPEHTIVQKQADSGQSLANILAWESNLGNRNIHEHPICALSSGVISASIPCSPYLSAWKWKRWPKMALQKPSFDKSHSWVSFLSETWVQTWSTPNWLSLASFSRCFIRAWEGKNPARAPEHAVYTAQLALRPGWPGLTAGGEFSSPVWLLRASRPWPHGPGRNGPVWTWIH